MRTFAILLLVVSATYATSLDTRANKLDLKDLVLNQFGFQKIVDLAQGVKDDAVQNLQQQLQDFLFKGKDLGAQAKVIVDDLVKNLASHAFDSSKIFAEASNKLKDVLINASKDLTGNKNTRDIWAQLGLKDFQENLKGVQTDLVNRLKEQAQKIQSAAKDLHQEGKGILADLLQKLRDHASEAPKIVAEHVSQIADVLQQQQTQEKRDLVDLIQQFGLTSIIDTVREIGFGGFNKLLGDLANIRAQGKDAIEKAKAILNDLKEQLKSHALDGVPLVQKALGRIHDEIVQPFLSGPKRDLAAGLFNNFGIGELLNTAKFQLEQKAKEELAKALAKLQDSRDQLAEKALPIVKELSEKLKNHFFQGGDLVNQAVKQLADSINNRLNPTKRDLFDIATNLFGLGKVWNIIKSVDPKYFEKFVNVLRTVAADGPRAIQKAIPIVNRLKEQLLSHALDALPIVQKAITDLIDEVLATETKRNLLALY